MVKIQNVRWVGGWELNNWCCLANPKVITQMEQFKSMIWPRTFYLMAFDKPKIWVVWVWSPIASMFPPINMGFHPPRIPNHDWTNILENMWTWKTHNYDQCHSWMVHLVENGKRWLIIMLYHSWHALWIQNGIHNEIFRLWCQIICPL